VRADLERFLRDAHIFARLVEQILEAGYLEKASGDRLTFGQLNILKFLARPGRKLIKDVAGFLNASYAAASKAVSRLEKKKLVRTRTWGEDARAELVEVTAKGHQLIEGYERYKAGRLETSLKGEDLELAARGLEQAIGFLMRDRDVAGNPCLACGVYYSKSCVSRLFGARCPMESCAPAGGSDKEAPPQRPT
jgi:DNA-binding MarR family transcriptional regulator